jgi:hypothetical protein
MCAFQNKPASNTSVMGKEEQDNPEQKRKKVLYTSLVQQIVDGWALGKPPLQSTGKPSGYYRLTNYLMEYILHNNILPEGIHPMPEGRDRNNNLEPSFLVDFDSIIGDISLPD